MDQIKPYLFYIVCGAIFVILIALMATITPSHAGAPDQTVAETKDAADRAYQQEIEDLSSRAQRTLERGDGPVPATPRSPENPEHVAEILNNFVVSDKWNRQFQAVVDDYRDQLTRIGDDLVERSQPLAAPVSESTDPGTWYQAYLAASIGVLTDALEADAIIVDDAPGGEAGATGGLGGPGAAVGGWTRIQLEENESLRSILGLYTKGTAFPGPSEHERLTLELRIAELLLDTVIRAEGETLPNPNVDQDSDLGIAQATGVHGARIVRLAFGRRQASDRMPGAELQRFTLTLRGSPAALLATLARIDSLSKPVTVRLGVEWGQPGTLETRSTGGFAPRSRRSFEPAPADAGDSILDVRIDATVIDYRGLAGIDLAAIPEEQ